MFISAAFGAVGSIGCQIAKLKGCRAIGSVGSDKKLRFLIDELGIDGGVNCKSACSLKEAFAQTYLCRH